MQTHTLHSLKTCYVKHVEKEILIINAQNNNLYFNSSYDFQNNQHQRLIVDWSLTLHTTVSDYFMQYMCCSYSSLTSVVDAMEKYGDRDAGEFIAASWAALDDLHTLFRDVLLEAWTSSRA